MRRWVVEQQTWVKRPPQCRLDPSLEEAWTDESLLLGVPCGGPSRNRWCYLGELVFGGWRKNLPERDIAPASERLGGEEEVGAGDFHIPPHLAGQREHRTRTRLGLALVGRRAQRVSCMEVSRRRWMGSLSHSLELRGEFWGGSQTRASRAQWLPSSGLG